jgi:hypothetical protein
VGGCEWRVVVVVSTLGQACVRWLMVEERCSVSLGWEGVDCARFRVLIARF